MDVFKDIIPSIPQVYIVLDALDECSDRAKLLELLTTMSKWAFPHLYILTTSRKEQDITDSMSEIVPEAGIVCFQNDRVDHDIERYIEERLHEDKALTRWRTDITIQEEIKSTLIHGAQGM